MGDTTRQIVTRHGAILLFMCFLAIVWLTVFRLPAWEAPDEPMHVAVARDVASGRASPLLNSPGTTGENHQAPLYYIIAAPLVGLADGTWFPEIWLPFPRGALASLYALRFLSSLMALATVISVYLTIKSIMSRELLALGTTAFAALTPGFVLTSSSANNDNAVIMFSSLSILFMARAANSPRFSFVNTLACGAALSAALLSKITSFILIPPFVALIGAQLFRRREAGRGFVAILPIGIPALAAATIWLSTSGWGTAFRITALLEGHSTLSPQNAGWVIKGVLDGQLIAVFWSLLTSYWGFAGWQTYAPLPLPVASIATAVAILGVIGSIRFLIGSWRERRLMLGLFLFSFALIELLLVSIASQLGKPGTSLRGVAHARFLFPAIGAASAVQFAGTTFLLPRRFRLYAGIILITLVVSFHISPTFARPAQYTGPIVVDKAQPFGRSAPEIVRFSNGVDALLRLAGTRLQAGDHLGVTLLWQTRDAQHADFTSFVHLVGSDGQAIVKDDWVPTLHRFPPRLWRAGDTVLDHRELSLPPGAMPGEYEVQLGSYLDNGRTVISIESAGGRQTRANLAKVIVEPPSVAPPADVLAINARFGDAIRLRAMRLDPLPRAGEQYNLTLFWQSTVAGLPDYAVSIQLLDGDARLMAQADGLLGGGYRTGLWRAGQWLAETYTLTVQQGWPAGRYFVAVAVYDPASIRRIPALKDNSSVDYDLVKLAEIVLR